MALLSVSAVSCYEIDDNKHKGQIYERTVEFSAYETDTVFSFQEFISAIDKIDNQSDWLTAEIYDSSSDSLKLRVSCTRNTTTGIRSALVTITCRNTDVMNLNVTQKIAVGVDDIHDVVSDRPVLAPAR